MALSLAKSIFFSNPTLFYLPNNGIRFLIPFSSSSSVSVDRAHHHKKRRSVIVSALELGGLEIFKDEIVRDDPTNNIPDTIFAKLGMQLHRRNQHPLGILKNAIYGYFDSNYPDKFEKFDDLCPIVSLRQNFDEVLVPADHVSRSYNDTYYVDSQTVLRCHTSAHQAELLRNGYTHFLVTGDVYLRDSIDSTHYPVFHQMEGNGSLLQMIGRVQVLMQSHMLQNICLGQWIEVLGCGVTEQEILKRSGRRDNVAWRLGLGWSAWLWFYLIFDFSGQLMSGSLLNSLVAGLG